MAGERDAKKELDATLSRFANGGYEFPLMKDRACLERRIAYLRSLRGTLPEALEKELAARPARPA